MCEAGSIAKLIADGFHAGLPLRPLIDAVEKRHGTQFWKSVDLQRELIGLVFDEHLFFYGWRREQRLSRIILDETDRNCEGSVAEELYVATLDRCQAEDPCQKYAMMKLDGVTLRYSDAFSDIGMRLWDAGVALYEALRTPGNRLRRACAGNVVLEVGAGVGLSGTAYESAGVEKAILTELPGDVLDNLKHNVASAATSNVECMALDVYDTAATNEIVSNQNVKTVLAADVCYDPDLTRAVVRACLRLAKSGVHSYMLATRRSDTGFQILQEVGYYFPAQFPIGPYAGKWVKRGCESNADVLFETDHYVYSCVNVRWLCAVTGASLLMWRLCVACR